MSGPRTAPDGGGAWYPGSMRLAPLLFALFLAMPAGASRLDEIGERIELLGRELPDAIHAACREALPPASELQPELRATAAARDGLQARCRASYAAWSASAARLDETGDFDELERHQRELLPCWDEIEALRAEVKDQARRCLDLARRGQEPLLPFGLSELDTPADLSPWVRCGRRDLCQMRPEALAARDPGWLGPGARQVTLGFSRVGIEQVLTSVFASWTEPSCESARDRLLVWRERLDASWEGDLGGSCAPAALVAAIGDHLVVLLMTDKGSAYVAGALVVHDPWRILREHSFPH